MFSTSHYLAVRNTLSLMGKRIYIAKAKGHIRKRYPVKDCPLAAYGMSVLMSMYLNPSRLPQ